ncbi:MAG TPA: Cache 3/Cache 2 fusion domain-containing protein, partial [Devosia sp.]|nr:Cache 3/Cache 2 fusion domain-containing protein [Devosia sp.]
MGKVFKRLFGNIKLTSAIAIMTIGSIAIAIIAVSLGLFISLSGSTRDDADKAVTSAMRITAAILQVNLPSLEVLPDEAGNVAGLQMRSMPRFRSHEVIDTIARTTGEQAVIYVFNPEVGPDFLVGTSSLLQGDGERLMDAPIIPKTALYDALMAKTGVRGTATINEVAYFTLYQPVLTADGTVLGAIQVGVARAPVEAVLGKSLTTLAIVGSAALLLIGVLALLLSRRLTRSIPILSGVMSAIAGGELDTSVPYVERSNEIGAMARAVEVFRHNGLKVAELNGAEQARQVQALDERSAMMGSLLQAFGQVVDAAVAGDFSQRVAADFPDAELNLLATSVNNLVATVERGLDETQTVLAALADTNLSVRMQGD